ncbi:unnamed protein product [Owenia fusiformis]|uniref:S-adenosylmethionine sensor upstream of mTORC1 n=1 Tax=Owenia fusiformis TaxID=6347 RepID=A0A8J1UCL5_OWEFU|nr:unnamed protein product [Owenia fusiformis]
MPSGSSAKKKKSKRKHASRRPVTYVKQNKKAHSEVISTLHNLNKAIESTKANPSLTKAEKEAHIKELQKDVEEAGGIAVYQVASKRGESKHGSFNSAKWVVKTLKKHKVKPASVEEKHLQLLDVGALDENYQKWKSWICATAIDLNPQSPAILQADFLDFKKDVSQVYDVIVLSLVLNFAGDPIIRGKMLKQARRLCKIDGHVLIVLPLPCVKNSRYMTHDLLKEIMVSLGFTCIDSHDSKRLAFMMFKKSAGAAVTHKVFPKKEMKNGVKMNNFTIVIK